MAYIRIDMIAENKISYYDSFALSYPEGENAATFFSSSDHTLGIGSHFYRAPRDFMVSFLPDRIELLWLNQTPIMPQQMMFLNLEVISRDYYIHERTGTLVQNIYQAHNFMVDFGTPVDANAKALSADASPDNEGNYQLDYNDIDRARNIVITDIDNRCSDAVFRIIGEDIIGNPMIEEVDIATAGGQVSGAKAFSVVKYVALISGTAGSIAVGVGRAFGLPVVIPTTSLVLRELCNGHMISGGYLVRAYSGVPMARSSDRRGLYIPPDDIPLDGSNLLNLLASLPNPANIGTPDYYDLT